MADVRALIVVIPAHDEQELVAACLRSVQAAVAVAGLPCVIVLVAHRCSDATEQIARAVLAEGGGLVLVNHSRSVATARSAGVAHGLAVSSHAPEHTWILSTDADTVVPLTWVADLRRHIDRGAEAVVGLVELDGWQDAPHEARRAYQAIIRAKLHRHSHDHVYAANLAVRADAYLAVGGWPDVVPGEDAALVARLRRRGRSVISAVDVWVRTSARRDPRAEGGLGTLLDELTLAASRDLRDAG
jgi:cellulose synthase/poly-beta-1,6-N-acetylglucosamine synthase-like glycosyltransferase